MDIEFPQLQKCRSALVVEDSPTSRTLLNQLLKTLPVKVEFAKNVAECRQWVEKKRFDFILLDYKLPDGNGLELLAEIRQYWPQSTLIVVTGQSDIHTATQALGEGADGYLEKRHLKEGPVAFHRTLEQAINHRLQVLSRLEFEGLKDEIYDLIVHDLRSPAARASMALKIYQSRPADEIIETAVKALDQLFYRLDRYIDFTKMDRGFLELKSEDNCLTALTQSLVKDLTPQAEAKSQTLQRVGSTEECPYLFDWDWMYQVFENLLENAIKYTPEGGSIQLE